MTRYKLTIEYEGTRYAGWQIQKGANSVQGEIINACRELFRTERFDVHGAGRTDGGVHATHQVAHIDADTELPLLRIKYGINDRLPADINIISVEEADKSFNARHDAIARSYIYQISQRRTAFGKKFVWWIKDQLNIEAMQAAAVHMTGLKNFINFTDPDLESESTKTEVKHISVSAHGDLILIHVLGSHFLWKQVRRMTGVLVDVGRGNMAPEMVQALFKGENDMPAKLTAPPSGLFLDRVYYGDEAFNLQAEPLLQIKP